MLTCPGTSILDLEIPLDLGICKCIDLLLPIKQYIVKVSGTTSSISYDKKILFLFSDSKCTIAYGAGMDDELSFYEYSLSLGGSLNLDRIESICVPFIKSFIGINFDIKNEFLLFGRIITSEYHGLGILNLGMPATRRFFNNTGLVSLDSRHVWSVHQLTKSGIFLIYRIDPKDLLTLRNQKEPEIFWRDQMESEIKNRFSNLNDDDIAVFPPVSFLSVSDISNSFFVRRQKASKLVINNKTIRRGSAVSHMNACFHEDTIIFWKVCSELGNDCENHLIIFPPIPIEYVLSKKVFNLRHLPDPLVTTFKKNLSYVFFIPEERRVILGNPVSYDFPWSEQLWSNYLVDTTHSSMMFIKPYGIRIYPVWNVLRGVPYTAVDMNEVNKRDSKIKALLRAKHPYRFPKFDKWGNSRL